MKSDQVLKRFKEVVNQPEHEINLAEAALLIAADRYPALDLSYYLGRLDAFAEQVRPAMQADQSPQERIERLNRYLFDELGFRGNEQNYYDARNSYLNEVIDRRVGLPITLSLIYVEVGRRLGMPLVGVGLPGHFIVKWHDPLNEIFVDPFHGGNLLDENGLLSLIEGTFHTHVQLLPEWLEAVGPRYILKRMLSNLRDIFLEAHDFEQALDVVLKLLILQPDSQEQLREAGLLSYRVGSFRRAAELLEDYLLHHPDASDAIHLRTFLHSAWVAITRLN